MKIVTRIRPSTTTNELVWWIGSRSVTSAGVTLKSAIAKPIATANAKMSWPRESSAGGLADLGVLVLRGVVRGDGERAEADRERLAEREDAADDGQARECVALHRRIDVPRDVRDVAVRLADCDRPVRRAAHHHALEDGLSSVADCHVLG